MTAIYMIEGKPHRLCDCDNRTAHCPQGRTRQLQTAGFNQCLIPAPDVVTTEARCIYCQSAAIREGNAIARAEAAERKLAALKASAHSGDKSS